MRQATIADLKYLADRMATDEHTDGLAAVDMVRTAYNDSEIVLDADDFADVKATPLCQGG